MKEALHRLQRFRACEIDLVQEDPAQHTIKINVYELKI